MPRTKRAQVKQTVFRIDPVGKAPTPARMSQTVENHRVRLFVQCANKVRQESNRNEIWFDYFDVKEALYMRGDARITENRRDVFSREVEKENMRWFFNKEESHIGLVVYDEWIDDDVAYEAMEKFFTVAGRPAEL